MSVKIVAPIVTVTASLLITPKRLTIGYANSVWEANKEPIRIEAFQPKPNQRPTSVPAIKGTRKVKMPKVNERLRVRWNCSMSISSPATNIR